MDDNKQNMIKKDDYIFGLDIGTSKINLFVGAIEGNSVRVLECGDFPLAMWAQATWNASAIWTVCSRKR